MSKNKEILDRYKGLVKSNYKVPTNGKFDDCTTRDLADLQAEGNSESEEESKSKARPERFISRERK